MRTWLKTSIAVLVLALAACSGTVRRVPFDESEYRLYGKPGTLEVTGKAVVETPDGPHTAAGNEVILNPVTSYSKQWYQEQYLGGKTLGQRDPRLEKYVLKDVAGADGSFRFSSVPRGEYYVVAPVTWREKAGESRREILVKRIAVTHRPVEILLSRTDNAARKR